MSERQFTFNEKLASSILCTAQLAQKTCEDSTVDFKGALTKPSVERLWIARECCSGYLPPHL